MGMTPCYMSFDPVESYEREKREQSEVYSGTDHMFN